MEARKTRGTPSRQSQRSDVDKSRFNVFMYYRDTSVELINNFTGDYLDDYLDDNIIFKL